jgi:geranylgeranyl diphosphate synthase type II
MHIETYKSAVEARVDAWLDAAAHDSPTTEGTILVDRIRSLVARGGKRFRPQLLLMAYEAYGGKDSKRLVDLGAALEMHHQFLLAHDDIIDHDTIRYNGPNVIGYYLEEASCTKREVAEGMGLLAGDLLFSFAQKIITESESYTDTEKVALLRLLNIINIDEAYGQQLDSYNIDPSPDAFSLDRLILTHTLKSARYSTQLPMQSAAVLLGLNEAEREKIDSFAVPFGIMFQLADDYSDYFTNTSAFNNRPKHRDYRQGKVTHPFYIGLTESDNKDVAFLQDHIGDKELSDELMDRVVSILEQSGARDICKTHIEMYAANTHDAIEKLQINTTSKQQFQKLLTEYTV